MAKKPDYRISALNKATGQQGVIGAAWNDPRGHIAVKFNPFVTVPVGKDAVISLFPLKDGEYTDQPPDEEIPF